MLILLGVLMIENLLQDILASGALFWKSAKQTLVASSTMQVEFITCYGVATQAMWLKSFIFGLLIIDSISRPITIYCYNSAVVFFTKNIKNSSDFKHIEIKYLAVRDMVKKNDIVV